MPPGRLDECLDGRQRVSERERRSRAGKVRTILTEKQLNVLKTCFRFTQKLFSRFFLFSKYDLQKNLLKIYLKTFLFLQQGKASRANPPLNDKCKVMALTWKIGNYNPLQRQPSSGRSDERAAGGDDRPQSAGCPGLVPEQTL